MKKGTVPHQENGKQKVSEIGVNKAAGRTPRLQEKGKEKVSGKVAHEEERKYSSMHRPGIAVAETGKGGAVEVRDPG